MTLTLFIVRILYNSSCVGRLPCSAVTHALLASYLLQSELGDHEEGQAGAALCSQLKLVPPSACTPELEEKVLELHKTHR